MSEDIDRVGLLNDLGQVLFDHGLDIDLRHEFMKIIDNGGETHG